MRTTPCGAPRVVDIKRSGSCRFLIRAPSSGIDALRHLERLAEAAVEALGDVARELEVLPLVVADRDDVGLVEQDVAGHQHGVVEEPGGDELLLLGLLLELRHSAQLAEARDRAQAARRPRRAPGRGSGRRPSSGPGRGPSRRAIAATDERRLVAVRSGSNGVVIECRSTTQKNASPCSWVATYWRKPPL